MRYGNSFRQLKPLMVSGLVIGLVGYVFSACMFLFVEHLPPERLIPLTFILVVPAMAMFVFVAPTAMFSIHINEGWVEHRFLDRRVLSRARTCDFKRMIFGVFPFAAVLDFTDGTRMRILGAQPGILRQLQRDLDLIPLSNRESQTG